MRYGSRYLHAVPILLALAVGVVLYVKLPPSSRSRSRISDRRRETAMASPMVPVSAEPVRIPPRSSPPQRPAVVPRTDSGPLVEAGWVYTVVTDRDWSAGNLERLRSLFLRPPTTEAWEMALWAVRNCPLAEATGWIEEFLSTNPSVRDRSDAILALSEREETRALFVLQTQLASVEPLLSVAAAEAIARRSLWDPAARPLADSLSRDPRCSRFLSARSEGE